MKPSKVNILLVDDYPANLVALGAVLSDPMYNLIEATSGAEALKIAQTTELALILLDIQMPDMNGFEVAKQIRANPKTQDVPIIFITAVYHEEPSVREGYEAGGQDYLGKPFDPEVLKAKVGVYSNLFLKNAILEKRTRELIKSEEHYRLIVESAQEIIATVDIGGVITSLNLAFEKLTGLKATDWIGKSFVPLIDPDDVQEILSHFGQSANEDAVKLSTTRIRAINGQFIPIEISVQPLRRDGHMLGTVGVMRNISSRERL